MKLKLDENLGISHLRFLRELGYPADRVHEEGLSGASDEAVWRRVCEKSAFSSLWTLDSPTSADFRLAHIPASWCYESVPEIEMRFRKSYPASQPGIPLKT
jgi:hypothetical protein